MSDTDTDGETDSEAEQNSGGPEGNPFFHAQNIRVYSDGYMTIPAHHRDVYDIDQYDVVDVLVEASAGSGPRDLVLPDCVVNADGAIQIPEKKRRLYGISEDERYNITVETTDLRLPPVE